ncbi:retrotransposon protein, putative, ty1-copia subclass [Tanacetum coccineum]
MLSKNKAIIDYSNTSNSNFLRFYFLLYPESDEDENGMICSKIRVLFIAEDGSSVAELGGVKSCIIIAIIYDLGVIMIKGGKIQKAKKKSLKAKSKGKANGKGNDKQVYIPKPKNPKPSAKEHLAKDDTCHHYKEVGHWKSNCPVYLAKLLKKKRSKLALPVIQGFREEKKLKQGALYLYVTNGVRAQVEAIGSFDLVFPNGLVICLDNCHYASSITRGKMTRKSFPHHSESATDLLGIIHTDVYGPLRHVSRQGASYFITFTDDYSRYGYVYLLKHKHVVFETFKVFKNEVENQLGKIIKALRSDRGGEYISQEFKDYLKACGIIQQLTPPYTPQHNVVSERRNRTLLDMIRSMMNLTTLPLSFWDYALESATRILNMVPTKKVDKTSYELWYEKVTNLSYLKVWGYEALVKRDTPDKLQQRSVKYLEEIQDEDTSPSEITSEIPMKVKGFEPPQEEMIPIRRDLNEPTSYKAAMLDSESNKWIDAMNTEIQSMINNKVWVLVDLPPNYKNVGSKWVFKKITDMDGIVHTYKARLVAKGYTQLYGVDYEETFSPVTDIKAIRILISIAAFYDYEIWQMDVKTAFLNGYLDKDIYMVQLEGFVDPKHPRKVCKLQRSIYGLKQASRSWNKRFDEEIKRFGFAQNLDEPCVYQKASGSNVTLLILYVDDIIIMGNHIPSLQSVKDYLGKCFAMKDLGEAVFILGIKIYRDRSKRLIGLGQKAYMDKILKRYKMDNSKRGHIPMQERLDLNKTQGASTPKENPGESHWTAVKNILKYLRNTKDIFLVYSGNPEDELQVDCYCDARFETNRDDTKSETGYVFILNGDAVDWKSSKQSTTAMSATESEYKAALEVAMKAVWIRKFISGLDIEPIINELIKMFCDNSAALHFANEPRVQRGARHYHRRYHYVRESIALGEIKFLKVHTDDNLADPFTNALPKEKLTQHARSTGLRLASSFM